MERHCDGRVAKKSFLSPFLSNFRSSMPDLKWHNFFLTIGNTQCAARRNSYTKHHEQLQCQFDCLSEPKDKTEVHVSVCQPPWKRERKGGCHTRALGRHLHHQHELFGKISRASHLPEKCKNSARSLGPGNGLCPLGLVGLLCECFHACRTSSHRVATSTMGMSSVHTGLKGFPSVFGLRKVSFFVLHVTLCTVFYSVPVAHLAS